MDTFLRSVASIGQSLAALSENSLAANPFTLAAAAISSAIALWFAFRLFTRNTGPRQAVVAAIGTANPPDSGGQAAFLDICRNMGYAPELMAKVERIVQASGVDRRFTVVAKANPQHFMSTLEDEKENMRARLWEEHAPKLALEAAKEALGRWKGGTAKDVTHVVVHR
jgi:Chalcone and stilbene synthases, N-terminal domain